MSRENPQQEVAEPELRDASQRVDSRGMRDAERYASHAEAKHARRSASTASYSTVAFKFGGSSLLGAERMRHAAGLVRPVAQSSRVVVVVSAMKGVTDRLLRIGQALTERDAQRAHLEAESVLTLHHDVVRELLADAEMRARVAQELRSLGEDLLYDVRGAASALAIPELFDRLASFGERFAARLFAAALAPVDGPAVPV